MCANTKYRNAILQLTRDKRFRFCIGAPSETGISKISCKTSRVTSTRQKKFFAYPADERGQKHWQTAVGLIRASNAAQRTAPLEFVRDTEVYSEQHAVASEQDFNPVDILRRFLGSIPRVFNFSTYAAISVCAVDFTWADGQNFHGQTAPRRLLAVALLASNVWLDAIFNFAGATEVCSSRKTCPRLPSICSRRPVTLQTVGFLQRKSSAGGQLL